MMTDPDPAAAARHAADWLASRQQRPDYVEAAIETLEGFVRRLRGGQSCEDVGPDVACFGRVMGRRT